jgi:cytochrome c oxidase assembly protein subunit 17
VLDAFFETGHMSVTEDRRPPLQEKSTRGVADNRVGAVADSMQADEKPAKPKKICCACPETKQARDQCIIENGEEACAMLVEAHKICLRAEGFNV